MRGRRDFILNTSLTVASAMAASMLPLSLAGSAWAAGSDAPEKKEVKIGFIPLTDCASVVMAAVKGYDKQFGIKIIPSKEASWAAVRDKLISGELDAAHVLYGLVYGVQLGVGGPQKDMAVLMTINNNGQGITLANQMQKHGVTTGEQLAKAVQAAPGQHTFAQTFPTGTHAMWLYYWLASFGINPVHDVKSIVVPPPQMVANMRVGNMHGCCVGEPWNARAIFERVGFTVATSQAVWKDHPEKVLGTTAAFVAQYPNTARAMIMALLEASRYIDETRNRAEVAKVIAAKSYVNTSVRLIQGRMQGDYEDGLGKQWQDPDYMKFYNDGLVNFPYLSDGMWFLTQHRRWGLLDHDPDYLAVATQVNRVALYKEAASQVKVPIPSSPLRASTLMDGVVWDGQQPAAYAASFKVRA